MTTEYRWQERIRTRSRGVLALGYVGTALFVGSFGVWAATAPLAGAVIAPGTFAAAGRNIQVQHLEGGVVRQILAQEGDTVTKGQTLIELDPTSPQTLLNRLINQAITLEMMALRLSAERDGLSELSFPVSQPGWTSLDKGQLAASFVEQKKEFDVRLSRFKTESEMLRQRIIAYQEAVTGLEAQKRAVAEQLAVVREEMDRKKGLLDKGLTNRSEYSQLLRSEAELVGQAGAVEAQLVASQVKTVEGREDIVRLATRRVEEAIAKLNEVGTSLLDVQEQIVAAEQVLTRTKLRSPTDGIVVSAVYNAVGSVLAPGERVFEILPTLPSLIVEARISPLDIRKVRTGNTAKLRLVALNQRITPEVAGTVIHVSADRLVDKISQEAYYLIRLKLTDDLPEEIRVEDLSPGMPVEAFVEFEARTFLEYLARPLIDSFNRAFVEE
jgi:HlyD family secretion protein